MSGLIERCVNSIVYKPHSGQSSLLTEGLGNKKGSATVTNYLLISFVLDYSREVYTLFRLLTLPIFSAFVIINIEIKEWMYPLM